MAPQCSVYTNPLTAEFIAGAAIGILYDHKNMRGAAWAGFIGLLMLGVSIVFVAPALALAHNRLLFPTVQGGGKRRAISISAESESDRDRRASAQV